MGRIMKSIRLEKRLAAVLMVVVVLAAPVRLDAETPEKELNRLIRPYSTQQIVRLNTGETYTFKLNNGIHRVVRLASCREHRDSVVQLMRAPTFVWRSTAARWTWSARPT